MFHYKIYFIKTSTQNDNLVKAAFIILLIFVGNLNTLYSQEISKPTEEELVWRNAGFKNTNISTINFNNFYDKKDSIQFTHVIYLTLINLRGAGWDKELIAKATQRAAEVYEQCGIKIGGAKYIETDAPNRIVDISMKKNHDAHLANMLPIKKRPVIFFIKTNIEGATGFQWRFGIADLPILHTIFITSEVNSKEYIEKRTTGYSPIAHEIAHQLCDCQHIEGTEYNLLSRYWARVDSTITEEQCDTFKKIGMKVGLLKEL